MQHNKRGKATMNIDKRHNYGIMLDTETANTIVTEKGKMDMSSVLPYDIGFAVIDSCGRIYETHSYINSDIFFKEPQLMQSAYYAKKIPTYLKDIEEGKRIVKNSYEIRKTLLDKCAEYDCKFWCAHNARFDLNACNNLIRWDTKSKYRYFFPYDLKIWDTLAMSRSILSKMPTYTKFCEDNNFVTKHKKPRPQYTAEVVYRYITKDTQFKEKHTGLEDVLIEIEILKYLKRQHKPMRKLLFQN